MYEEIKTEIEKLDDKYRTVRVNGTIQQAKEADLVVHVLHQLSNFIESLEKEQSCGEIEDDAMYQTLKIWLEKGKTQARDEFNNLPKIKGWVARDIHGTLRLYGNDAADGMGIRTGELPSPYKELMSEDEPIEVELTIHRV